MFFPDLTGIYNPVGSLPSITPQHSLTWRRRWPHAKSDVWGFGEKENNKVIGDNGVIRSLVQKAECKH